MSLTSFDATYLTEFQGSVPVAARKDAVTGVAIRQRHTSALREHIRTATTASDSTKMDILYVHNLRDIRAFIHLLAILSALPSTKPLALAFESRAHCLLRSVLGRAFVV